MFALFAGYELPAAAFLAVIAVCCLTWGIASYFGTKEAASTEDLRRRLRRRKSVVLHVTFRNRVSDTGIGVCQVPMLVRVYCRLGLGRGVTLEGQLKTLTFADSEVKSRVRAELALEKWLHSIVRALEADGCGVSVLLNGSTPDWTELDIRAHSLGLLEPTDIRLLWRNDVLDPARCTA